MMNKENVMKSWNELSKLEQYSCIYWDMYKSAFDIRPRGIDTSQWTESDYEHEFARLNSVIEENMKLEKVQEAISINAFEAEVARYIDSGAGDRQTALRWMTQTEDLQSEQDIEHWVWSRGLLFSPIGKSLVDEIISLSVTES